MNLTAVQEDALIEVINIGFGRAAASLSKLTGQRVQLEVPQIAMCPIDELSDRLRPMIANEVASVHQIFSGAVAGDALLVIDQQSAAILKELLTNEPALPLDIDASAREVLTEIGNILLNACLGTFGNLLHVQVSFSVPHLTLESLEGVVGSITVNREGLRYALIVHAALPAEEQQPDRLSGHRAECRLDRAADPRRSNNGNAIRGSHAERTVRRRLTPAGCARPLVLRADPRGNIRDRPRVPRDRLEPVDGRSTRIAPPRA